MGEPLYRHQMHLRASLAIHTVYLVTQADPVSSGKARAAATISNVGDRPLKNSTPDHGPDAGVNELVTVPPGPELTVSP